MSFPQGIAANSSADIHSFYQRPHFPAINQMQQRNALPTAYFRDNILCSEGVSESRKSSFNKHKLGCIQWHETVPVNLNIANVGGFIFEIFCFSYFTN